MGRSLMYGDPILRKPDYLAGTLASLDFKENLVQHEKHSSIPKGFFAASPFCSTLMLDTSGGTDLVVASDDVPGTVFTIACLNHSAGRPTERMARRWNGSL